MIAITNAIKIVFTFSKIILKILFFVHIEIIVKAMANGLSSDRER